MKKEFFGYVRNSGLVGTRNYVGIMSTVVCANEVARAIKNNVNECTLITHHQGCCQTPPDLKVITDSLISLAKNPNLGAILLVSLGCEGTNVDRIEKEITAFGKPVKKIVIQEVGGSINAINEGSAMAKQLLSKISSCRREKVDISRLIVGIKCGSSDATSGLASNPATGVAVDMLVKSGGSVIFGETTEFIGAEQILTKRASNKRVSNRIYEIVNNMEKRAKTMGVDMRQGQPTPGNIAGGLSSIEEKSLGAIVKSGSCQIEDVLNYSEFLGNRKGLYIKDTPGREPDALTGFVIGGASVVLFTTGRGAPQGHPVAPVIKICGNPQTVDNLGVHIDVDVSSILTKSSSIKKLGEKIFQEIIDVASGKKVKAEICNYNETMEIWVKGPVI